MAGSSSRSDPARHTTPAVEFRLPSPDVVAARPPCTPYVHTRSRCCWQSSDRPLAGGVGRQRGHGLPARGDREGGCAPFSWPAIPFTRLEKTPPEPTQYPFGRLRFVRCAKEHRWPLRTPRSARADSPTAPHQESGATAACSAMPDPTPTGLFGCFVPRPSTCQPVAAGPARPASALRRSLPRSTPHVADNPPFRCHSSHTACSKKGQRPAGARRCPEISVFPCVPETVPEQSGERHVLSVSVCVNCLLGWGVSRRPLLSRPAQQWLRASAKTVK